MDTVQQWEVYHGYCWSLYADMIPALENMKRLDNIEREKQKTDKSKFHYAYALGYCRKAMNEKRQEIRIGKPKKFGEIDPQARYFPADTDAVDITQAAYLLWHKSRMGKRVPLDTRASCRFAVRNYWRSKQIERIKGDTDNAVNPNGKYAYAAISTARKNNMSNVQTSDGVPDKMTRNLDLQTVDMEQADATITMVVRLLSTGASQRDVANQTDLSEMQVSRIIKRLRDLGAEYWGMRKQGETIPETPVCVVAERAPKTFKPIAVVQSNEQTVSDHSPIRISEQRYSAQWREYAATFRNATDTSLRENVDNYGYTENDMANPMPNDNDSAFKGEIIYS